jgi:hypothetical protein
MDATYDIPKPVKLGVDELENPKNLGIEQCLDLVSSAVMSETCSLLRYGQGMKYRSDTLTA